MRANKTRRKKSIRGPAQTAIARPNSQAELCPGQTSVAVARCGRNPRRAIIQTDSCAGVEHERCDSRQFREDREDSERRRLDGAASSAATGFGGSLSTRASTKFLGRE